LLLDEPASGLDPEARHSLSALLRELRDHGMVIIVSSHILAELEDYSTELLVIQDGKMIEHRTLSTVLNQLRSMVLRFEGGAGNYADRIANWQGVSNIMAGDNNLVLSLDESVLPKKELIKKLVESNLPLTEFAEEKLNLQEQYIKTVQQHKNRNN
jgi:ABC-2 type transport system ATP-binding protein